MRRLPVLLLTGATLVVIVALLVSGLRLVFTASGQLASAGAGEIRSRHRCAG